MNVPDIPILRGEASWLVVDKPPGLPVHSGPDGRDVLACLAARFPGEALAAVHRLDAATSGCLLVARTKSALRFLARAFARREVEKLYLAVVEGQPMPPDGEIFTHLGETAPGSGRMMAVEPGAGPTALTRYRTIRAGRSRSLVEAMPVTGRTHQLRVHFRHLGHPIAGDPVYAFPGAPPAPRLCLHAHRLSFPDPELPGGQITVEAPVPDALEQAMGWGDA